MACGADAVLAPSELTDQQVEAALLMAGMEPVAARQGGQAVECSPWRDGARSRLPSVHDGRNDPVVTLEDQVVQVG